MIIFIIQRPRIYLVLGWWNSHAVWICFFAFNLKSKHLIGLWYVYRWCTSSCNFKLIMNMLWNWRNNYALNEIFKDSNRLVNSFQSSFLFCARILWDKSKQLWRLSLSLHPFISSFHKSIHLSHFRSKYIHTKANGLHFIDYHISSF